VRKKTFRRLGLTSCMLLTIAAGLPLGLSSARAETDSNGITTTVDPVTGIVNTTGSLNNTPTISAGQFNQDPTSLLNNQNPSALGTNVSSLLQQGVSPSSISSVLGGTGSATGSGQWSSILSGIQSGNINPNTAASLVSGVFSGNIPTDLGQALSSITNLGNSGGLSGITNALTNPSIQNILSGLTGVSAGSAIDQIIQSALGGSTAQAIQNLATQAGVQAISNAVAAAAPQVAALLGATGLNNAVAGALNGAAAGAAGGIGGGTGNTGVSQAVAAAVNAAAIAAQSMGTCACSTCMVQIPQHHTQIKDTVTSEFEIHRRWILTEFFRNNILPAMMLMAEQLTTAGMLQVEMIGTFLDAKHQLETQRLFQTLTAKAHKDYHPSEGMCTFGTTVRSLAGSDRRSNLAQTVYAQKMMQRQALNGEAISYQGEDSDIRSRLKAFIANYCDQADNSNGLKYLCKTAVATPARRNVDVDFTRNIESRLTLDMDFQPTGTPSGTATASDDEKDVFALAANLYSHNIPPRIQPELLAENGGDKRVRLSAAEKYLDLRSIFAKRSVAQNSFAALIAMRTSGAPESAPYTKAVIRELGVSDDAEINKLLGDNPSYFAQMEILTKKIYQNPVFYTELYDKPANIERKGAALQAIGLMQDRDLYNSLLRSEAVLSVLLETQLQREQVKITDAMGNMNPAGGSR
jgi:hypothetical protein